MANVELEKQGSIGVITMNRPEALNALNTATLQELDAVIDRVEADDEILVAIITGAGGKAFVAGADIAEMSTYNPVQAKKFSETGNDLFLKIENMTKPIIAAVNGYALGGGNELAMSCDIRLAGENAVFGQPEVGLGITPGFGGTQRLARIVGSGRAMEIVLTARNVKAPQAKEIGLVNEVYPAEELMPAALKLAQRIAANAQIAVRESKRAIRRGLQCDMATGAAFEEEAFAVCFSTEDQKYGMSYFLDKNKEKPAKVFSNR
ncbi:MAG: enoyl-CoA hydratase-related protein [Oscillibacter sp.]|jgi:enoyl-CoA hydratase|nr:enoyl-CoA hydratase-related protein [Oscillibacter sp.]